MRLAEETDQGVDHRAANTLDIVELAVGGAVLALPRNLGGRGAEGGKIAKGLGKVARRRFPDMPDAERVDQTIERHAPARLDRLEQLVDRFFAIALLGAQAFFCRQAS